MNTSMNDSNGAIDNGGGYFNKTSTPTCSLNASEQAQLRDAGHSDEEIGAFEKGPGRSKQTTKSNVNIAGIVEQAKEQLLEFAPRATLWTSKSVGVALKRLGLYPEDIAYNGIGDALGKAGHRLPSVKRAPRLYHLQSVGTTDAEKEAVQRQLNELGRDVIAALTANIPAASEIPLE